MIKREYIVKICDDIIRNIGTNQAYEQYYTTHILENKTLKEMLVARLGLN